MFKLTPIALSLSLVVATISGCNTMQAPSENAQATTSSTSSNSSDIFSAPYVSKTLPNGLTIVALKTDYPNVVAMQIPVSTGSRNEVEPGKTGFAHFFEHMMFKGTKNTPQEKYDSILKNAGVDNRAFTTDDYTNYHSVFSNEHLETMIKLEADRFANLVYTDAQFKTEALTVKGEYLKNASNPIRQLLETLRNTAYTEHTYKHTTMGFFADIEKMPEQIAYGKTFFKRWYGPQNTSVVIVGDIDPHKTIELVEKYWGEWQKGDYKADIKPEPAQTASKYFHMENKDQPNNYIVTGYHGPKFDPSSKDYAAVTLLAELYFGDNSALYQNLVNDKKIANQLFTYLPEQKDPGLLMFFARSEQSEQVAMVRDAFAKTIAKAQTELFDQGKLDDLKNNLKYSFAADLDSSKSIAGMISGYLHFDHDPETVNAYYDSLSKVTVEDLQRVAKTYFTDNNRTTITMNNQPTMVSFDQEVSIASYAKKALESASTVAKIKLLDKRSDSAIIDINFLFNTGVAVDPEGKKGLSALLAAMLTQGGSDSHSYNELKQLSYPLAASFYGQVDKEMLSLRSRVHRDNLASWYPLLMEQLLTPGWRSDDLERLRTDLINSIESGLKASNDEELGKEVLYSKLYQGHAYQSLNLGDISDLKTITLDDLQAFYLEQLTQGNLTLGVAGDMSDQQLKQLTIDLAQLALGDNKPLTIAKAPTLTGRQVTIVDKPGLKSTAVSFGFPLNLTRSDDDWVAMWLVRSWLGQHRSHNSFLYQRIRQIRGMNYGDYSYIEYFPRGMYRTQPNSNLGRSEQVFQVWLRPLRDNKDAHFATRVAMFELDKLIENGLSPEQFDATRNFLKNYVPQLVASQDRQLGYALDSEFYGTGDFVDMVRNKLATLDVKQVNAAIKRHISTEDIQYVFVSGDAKDMAQRLSSEQVSPMSYNAEKPQSLTDQDKEISLYPLNIDSVETIALDKVFK